MTKIYVVKSAKKDEYYLYINELGMGKLEKTLAERFIKRYPHVKPHVFEDSTQWAFTNP